MKNLKKVLSLVLVFAMALGLMLSASAATWSDKDDITNAADAALLNSLQIMSGRADGTFDPEGFLTRGEVAKMIYVARTGGVDDKAVLFKGSSNLFSDTKGHWAEGYINYAAAKKFVSGRGNGKFDPNATITGYELLKIALTSLGYSEATEGFTGTNWKLNVAAAAMDAGLITGFTADPSLPITRDNAANIFANLIYANTVSYNTYGVLVRSSTDTFGTAYLNLTAVNGVVLENDGGLLLSEGAIATANAGKTAIAVSTVNGVAPASGNALFGTQYFSVASDASVLGKSVTLYIKGSNKAAVYGGVIENAVNKVVETNAALGTASNDTTLFSLRKFAKDNAVQIDSSTYLVTYSTTAATVSSTDISASIENKAGELLKLIDNDGDAKAEYAVKTIKGFDTVTAVTSTTDLLGTYTAYTGTELTSRNTDAVLAKGDVVLYYKHNGKFIANVAKSATGKATASTSNSLTIEGVVVKESSLMATSLINGQNLAGIIGNKSVGTYNPYTNSFIYYLDDAGYVFSMVATPAAVSNDYAVLIDAAYVAGTGIAGTSYTEAKLLFVDGTTKVVKLAAIGATTDFSAYTSGSWSAVKGQIYSYTIKDEKYSLTDAGVANATSTIAKGAVLVDGASDYYCTTSTIYLVQTSNGFGGFTYAAYVGYANAPAIASQTVDIVTPGSNVASIVYISNGADASSSTYKFYVTNYQGATYVYVPYGTSYYTVPAIINGEVGTVKVTDSADIAANGWYEIPSVPASGIVPDSGSAYTPASTVAVSYIKDGLIVAGSDALTYSDSTVVYVINATTKAVTKSTMADVAVGDNVFIIKNAPLNTAVVTLYVVK